MRQMPAWAPHPSGDHDMSAKTGAAWIRAKELTESGELLTTFEKSQQNTDLAKTISANVRSIDPNSPLGTFMTNNSIQIDKWFEALKYPESTKGQSFSHIDLKYGGLDTVPFWQSIGEATRQVRLQAVALSRERGYV